MGKETGCFEQKKKCSGHLSQSRSCFVRQKRQVFAISLSLVLMWQQGKKRPKGDMPCVPELLLNLRSRKDVLFPDKYLFSLAWN